MTETPKEIETSASVTSKQIRELEWIEKLTHYMDNLVRVPGTKFRFGIDPILGLIPFGGEIVSFVISSIILLALIRHGTSGKLVVLMLSNVAVDTLAGAIPFLGDIFDFTFKANKRNVNLLKQYHHEGMHKGSGIKIILGVLAALLIIVFILIFISYWFLHWASSYIQPKLF